MIFHFEWHFILSDNIFWLAFYVEWLSFLNNILFWVKFNFEWHSILGDNPYWVPFHFEWHSILIDIPFEWHSVKSDIPFWVIGWCLNLNDENWGGIGLSISIRCVSQWVTIIWTRDASALEIEDVPIHNILSCTMIKDWYNTTEEKNAMCLSFNTWKNVINIFMLMHFACIINSMLLVFFVHTSSMNTIHLWMI